jgi:hypothetical protein
MARGVPSSHTDLYLDCEPVIGSQYICDDGTINIPEPLAPPERSFSCVRWNSALDVTDLRTQCENDNQSGRRKRIVGFSTAFGRTSSDTSKRIAESHRTRNFPLLGKSCRSFMSKGHSSSSVQPKFRYQTIEGRFSVYQKGSGNRFERAGIRVKVHPVGTRG